MAHANNTMYTTPADAGDGDPDCMGYRQLSAEELADLPDNWENPLVDTNKYYWCATAAWEVSKEEYERLKANGEKVLAHREHHWEEFRYYLGF